MVAAAPDPGEPITQQTPGNQNSGKKMEEAGKREGITFYHLYKQLGQGGLLVPCSPSPAAYFDTKITPVDARYPKITTPT